MRDLLTPRFVFGVDIDGVLADHSAGFAEFLTSYRGGGDPDSLPYRSSYDFGAWGVQPDDFERLHRIAVMEHHMLARMPMIDGASDVLWRLSDAGVWIRLITHRLYVNWGHAVTVSDTVRWLDEHRIPYRDICFLGDKPEVGADCYIDDAPHNVHALRAGGSDTIVFDQPYNRDLEPPRAMNWAEVERMIMRRLESPQDSGEDR